MPRTYTCKHCGDRVTTSAAIHRPLCTNVRANGGAGGDADDGQQQQGGDASVATPWKRFKLAEDLQDSDQDILLSQAEAFAILAPAYTSFPLAAAPWTHMYSQCKLVFDLWVQSNTTLPPASRPTATSPPSKEQLAAVADFVAGLITSAALRSSNGTGLTSTPARRTPFQSHGAIPEPGKAAPRTIFAAKPEAGTLATAIGLHRGTRKFHFKPTDTPNMAHLLACQHSLCENIAVFSNAAAMADLLGDVDPSKYPASFEVVKQTLITGEITDFMAFAGARTSAPPPTLHLIEDALKNLAAEFLKVYGPSCTLVAQLTSWSATAEPRTWFNAALEDYARANGGHGAEAAVSYDLPPPDAALDAAAFVKRRISQAIGEWQRQALFILKQHFLTAPMTVQADQDGIQHSVRVIGALPAGTLASISLPACLCAASAYVPSTRRVPPPGTQGQSSAAGKASGAGSKPARSSSGPVIDLATNPVPSIVLGNFGRLPKDIKQTLPQLMFKGAELCNRNMYAPNHAMTCKGCTRGHFWKLVNKSPD